jgi:hypothetical protein
MTHVSGRRFAVLAALLVAVACDSPIAPRSAGAAFRGVAGTAELCDATVNPICNAFVVTTYAYDPAAAPLPPGVSDWVLKVTQNGGSLEFLGAVSHGGAPIVDVANMFVRFYLDNGDGALGAGDLQVVVRSNFGTVEVYCGIVSSLPFGSVLAPTSTPPLCENSGTGSDAGGRFFFDLVRTADLTEPLWVAQGFQPLTVAKPRNIWLFEVGNVDLVDVLPILLAPTAPVEPTPYVLKPAAGPPIVPGDTGDTGGGTDDVTAPVINFTGNQLLYRVDQTVDIRCTASDAGSGIATANCPGAQGFAYTFWLGRTSLYATATDVAGNSAEARTAFDVVITPDAVCELAKRFATNQGIGKSLCAQLYAALKQARGRHRDESRRHRDRDRDHRGPDDDRRGKGRDSDRDDDRDNHRGRAHDRGGDAFARHVMAQRGKGLSEEHADLLIRLAAEL